MNSRAFAANSSTSLVGNQIETTGTGVFGRTSLFSGKRPLVRYSRSRFAAAALELASAPAEPFESTTIAWCIGTVTLCPALPSSLKPSVAACFRMLKSGRVRPCEG
jgi:hypothetical protein